MGAKPLNQWAISQILGSQVVPIRKHRFGGFGVLGTTAEYLRKRQGVAHPPDLTRECYRRIVKAFEEMRDGYAPDRILWDKEFAKAFLRAAHRLGVDLPDAEIKKRLIGIRKASRKFRDLGIEISPSTKRELHESPLSQNAPAIEFALVRVRYRFGASIDDILLDPALGDEFEKIASRMAPRMSSWEIRLGALYLRKSRYFRKARFSLLDQMDADLLESQMDSLPYTPRLRARSFTEEAGIWEILEGERYLFVSENENIRASISPFIDGSGFSAMSDIFWAPDLSQIAIRYYVGTEFEGIRLREWQVKLIHDRKPVFNWPVASKVA